MDWNCPYPSQRSPVFGRNVVATSQPLAAQAGLAALAAGGNAVDAALAAAITLTVVEPTNNGVGSDAFAIVRHRGDTVGLNASGRAPLAMELSRYAGAGTMPSQGWDSVTVPGAVSAWVALSERFGRLEFERLFTDAIRYARDGFAVTPIVARQWALTAGMLADQPGFAEAFLPEGRAPEAGETFRLPALAETLEDVAATRGESFYRGRLAARIGEFARAGNGPLTADDLAAHRADWVTPLAVRAAGVRLLELPPNGQGLAALLAMAILEQAGRADLATDSADALHLEIEAMKLALADAARYVGDPDAMTVDPATLLDDAYVASRAALIDPQRAGEPAAGVPGPGDTVYLSAADADGTMVSYIQSNYFGFGSGVVVPQTGISLQNRASGFCLEAGHPNCVGPGKRPFHTIIPAFVDAGGDGDLAFGVMGGPMQAQGHVQMVTRIYHGGQNPQAAADAPRWQVLGSGDVAVEEGVDRTTRDALEGRGHSLQSLPAALFGGAQLVLRHGDGYAAGSDPRKDGCAVAF